MSLLVIFWLGAVTGGAIQYHHAEAKAEADAVAVSMPLAPIEVQIVAEGDGK